MYINNLITKNNLSVTSKLNIGKYIAYLLLFSCMSFTVLGKENQLITVGYTVSSHMYKQSGEIRGPLADLHQCLFKDFNNVVYIEVATPDRLVMMLDANRVDVGVLLDRSEERDKYASFIGDYIASSVIEVSKKQPSSNLHVLGIRLGTNLDAYLAKMKSAEIVYAKTLPQLIEMFERGRLSHFIEAAPLIKDYISANANLNVREIGKSAIGMYSTHSLREKSKHIIDLLQDSASFCITQLPKHLRPQ